MFTFDQYKALIECDKETIYKTINKNNLTNKSNIYPFGGCLHLVCSNRKINIEILNYLFDLGASPNSVDCELKTALIYECSKQRPSYVIIEELLKRGADVNHQTKNKNSAIHYLCMKKTLNKTNFHLLLNYNVNLDLQGRNGITPLMSFLSYSNFCKLCFEIFLQGNLDLNKKTDVKNKTALHTLCSHKEPIPDLFKRLISRGANPDLVFSIGKHRHTAISYLCKSLQYTDAIVDSIKVLYEANCKINFADEKKKTLLHYICSPKRRSENSLKLATLFTHKRNETNLQKKTQPYLNPNLEDTHGVTAFHLACISKKSNKNPDLGVGLIKLLMESEIPVDLTKRNLKRDQTVLNLVCDNKSPDLEIIKYLIKKGAPIDLSNQFQESPLWVILKKHNPQIDLLKYFFKIGVKFDIQDKSSNTILHYISQHLANQLTLKLFLDFILKQDNSFINIINTKKISALDLIANNKKSSPEVISQFLLNGAKLNRVDNLQYQIWTLLFMKSNVPLKNLVLLLDRNQNINYQSKLNGNTALHDVILTYKSQNLDKVIRKINLLSEYNINFNLTNKMNKTPLYMATENNINFKIISTLINNGANINAIHGITKRTPLYNITLKIMLFLEY
ncbi:ankyrin repeat [Anaeramoeba flamelloides]|uniref:Ankyrin repeat n=1 Tax=Anaeramoeba flamelloides TaxID=1746091 RepID=A0ABQ8YLS1_9EUKA|nr:ankyrin repeat [Anaeramoeba flamelloides]